jgi:hypothetical protein
MRSRRSFLKLSGLAAVALSAGYGAGTLVNSGTDEFFTVYGLIPADENIVKLLLSSFHKKIHAGNPTILADEQWHKMISNGLPYASPSSDNATLSIVKMDGNVSSDILISDHTNKIYDPETDFNRMFTEIRSKIKNRKAENVITADYREKNVISRVFNAKEKVVVVENEKGIVDRISLKNSYKNIFVDGAQGKNGFTIQNGLVNIHTASCKNQICKHTGCISEPGALIACAPNKVLIRIEAV